MRCLHEAETYPVNCFITLTYDDDHLPANRSVRHRDFVLFMKRFRKKYPHTIRYYMCGEYGETFGRPHYHACIFNHDFDDRVFYKEENGVKLYTSEKLDQLWSDDDGNIGNTTVGDVTFQSAAYVARYIMSKITGDKAEAHYTWDCPETGEIHTREPEYTQQSRNIGKKWFHKWTSDVFPSDQVIINGKPVKPPKAYDKFFELLSPAEMEQLKFARVRASRKNAADQTPERLRVRETVLQSKLNQLKRTLK